SLSGLSYIVAEAMNVGLSCNAGGFSATSNDVVVSPAAPAQLVVTTQPSATATAGAPFATQPVVKEEDAFGNVITTDSTHTVTVRPEGRRARAAPGRPLTPTPPNDRA